MINLLRVLRGLQGPRTSSRANNSSTRHSSASCSQHADVEDQQDCFLTECRALDPRLTLAERAAQERHIVYTEPISQRPLDEFFDINPPANSETAIPREGIHGLHNLPSQTLSVAGRSRLARSTSQCSSVMSSVLSRRSHSVEVQTIQTRSTSRQRSVAGQYIITTTSILLNSQEEFDEDDESDTLQSLIEDDFRRARYLRTIGRTHAGEAISMHTEAANVAPESLDPMFLLPGTNYNASIRTELSFAVDESSTWRRPEDRRSLAVSAFDEQDLDATGMPTLPIEQLPTYTASSGLLTYYNVTGISHELDLISMESEESDLSDDEEVFFF